MSTARFIVGDSLSVLRSLPDASVDLVLTSPPFLALRSYLPADHPDKALEVGTEAGPGAFVDALLDVVEQCRSVLTPHGSLCVELGDTYSGARGYGSPDSPNPAYGAARFEERWEGKTAKRFKRKDDGWPLDKSMALVPESFRWALAYGRNPFTGRATEPWRVRNVIRWCRPNPSVGSLSDKFRPATSDLVVACMSRMRYFDLDAVRTPSDYHRENDYFGAKGAAPGQTQNRSMHTVNSGGAPPLDWWEVPTEPFKGSHYATWPSALLVRPIKAMCPERVCRTCGEPSRRIVDTAHNGERSVGMALASKGVRGGDSGKPDKRRFISTTTTTTGWTACGHDDWRPGVVLDPFAGSGTTLAVATGHGRDALGVDIDERNADLARERVGMFLTVEHFAAEASA